ncbi:solute carrier family 11 member 1 [Dictyostelium discoideum AX4]|uniref:Metal transporter nramp1 homolog n=1 Tax=Dictyostelium discoideum TaxID=44689 RepID=NRAM1_DICDI|nr:solute carrier family 11 member 1 [Dictyostelium discoideum AX4]Q869V1.1 RecName: Full=Metal transporter nramp1 homolog; AltName: Full=Natural resistance-associated membrane protein 1 [Dictyostelium discoideum]EAL68988.1 solute carrier family 11 member 1 [Dictyostelium discoideum AX4]|eukprot:XP_642974.1 solute carrier family 11 member 1 [Dictyostelium discoideum AX4]
MTPRIESEESAPLVNKNNNNNNDNNNNNNVDEENPLIIESGIPIEDLEQKNKPYLIKVPNIDKPDSKWINFKTLWAFTGPGFLMSIAYLDPGNLESDIQAGAMAGYQLLWVLFWSTVIGFWLQMLASRLGVVTGKHLAEHCREQYPKTPRLLLWLMTELAIIGSDIQEVIGTAIALQILSNGHIPLWAGVLFTAADTFTFLFLEKYGIRKLEAFFCSLIAIMAISFGVEYIISKPDQIEVVKGVFIPLCSQNNISQAVGILGAVVMPHNIYLHSALVQSREIDRKSETQVKIANKYNRLESAFALIISFIINLLLVSVFAKGFYGETTEIGLSSAADFLMDKYGKVAKYIWAIGLFSAGQCSTMTGTYSGQFVMEGFLKLKIAPWKRLLITRCTAIVPAMVVAILSTSHLDSLDQWLNILQSIQLPFAVVPVLLFTSSEKIMGSKFKNHWLNNQFVRFLSLLIIAINIYLIITFSMQISESAWMISIVSISFFFYFIFIVYLSMGQENFNSMTKKIKNLFNNNSNQTYNNINY